MVKHWFMYILINGRKYDKDIGNEFSWHYEIYNYYLMDTLI